MYIQETVKLIAQSKALPLSGVGTVIRQRLIQREGAISITPTYLAQERERKYTRVPCVSET